MSVTDGTISTGDSAPVRMCGQTVGTSLHMTDSPLDAVHVMRIHGHTDPDPTGDPHPITVEVALSPALVRRLVHDLTMQAVCAALPEFLTADRVVSLARTTLKAIKGDRR